MSDPIEGRGDDVTNIVLAFGALAPPLAEQLADYGLTLPSKTINAFQSDADAIVRLCVRGLLTEAGRVSARKRLLKNLIAALEKST